MVFLIKEFAYYRKKALDILYSKNEILAEHIAKCVIYGKNYKDFGKWTNEEITEFLREANNLNLKKSKLRPKDYLENLFCGIGDSVADVNQYLKDFKKKFVTNNPDPFPNFNITYDLCSTLSNAFKSLSKEMSEKLGSYDQEDMAKCTADIRKDLHEILDKYCESSDTWLI